MNILEETIWSLKELFFPEQAYYLVLKITATGQEGQLFSMRHERVSAILEKFEFTLLQQ